MSNQISFTYTFHAPRELVFKAFTEADHLKNWWGPKGWKFEVLQSDFRPGGVFLYSQKPDDGDAMWVKFVYSEIVTPEKKSFTLASFPIGKVTLSVHPLTKIGH